MTIVDVLHAVPPVFVSIGGMFNAVTGSVTTIATVYMILKQRKLAKSVNGRMSEQLEAVHKLGYLKGMAENGAETTVGEASAKIEQSSSQAVSSSLEASPVLP